jgi:hypothetical protein
MTELLVPALKCSVGWCANPSAARWERPDAAEASFHLCANHNERWLAHPSSDGWQQVPDVGPLRVRADAVPLGPLMASVSSLLEERHVTVQDAVLVLLNIAASEFLGEKQPFEAFVHAALHAWRDQGGEAPAGVVPEIRRRGAPRRRNRHH